MTTDIYKPLLEVEKKIGEGTYFITLKKDIRKEFEKGIEILEEKFFYKSGIFTEGFLLFRFFVKEINDYLYYALNVREKRGKFSPIYVIDLNDSEETRRRIEKLFLKRHINDEENEKYASYLYYTFVPERIILFVQYPYAYFDEENDLCGFKLLETGKKTIPYFLYLLYKYFNFLITKHPNILYKYFVEEEQLFSAKICRRCGSLLKKKTEIIEVDKTLLMNLDFYDIEIGFKEKRKTKKEKCFLCNTESIFSNVDVYRYMNLYFLMIREGCMTSISDIALLRFILLFKYLKNLKKENEKKILKIVKEIENKMSFYDEIYEFLGSFYHSLL